MVDFHFLLGDSSIPVSATTLMNNCKIFSDNHTLLVSDYRIKSLVSPTVVRLFVDALENPPVRITQQNVAELKKLADELQCQSIHVQITDSGLSPEPQDLSWRLATIEERLMVHDRLFFDKSSGVGDGQALKAEIARVNADVQSALKKQFASLEAFGRQLSGHLEVFVRMQELLVTTSTLRVDLDALNRRLGAVTEQVTALNGVPADIDSVKGSLQRLVSVLRAAFPQITSI
jgi:hypothetical protein